MLFILTITNKYNDILILKIPDRSQSSLGDFFSRLLNSAPFIALWQINLKAFEL